MYNNIILYVLYIVHIPAALIPHMEAVNFNLQQFIKVLHSVGGVALVLLYLLLADG